MSLTEALIRKAKPRENQYRLHDSSGLLMIVTPSGGYWWRFKYRFGGKQNSLSFGTYPDVSLKEARMKRDEAREMIKAGIDPSERRKEARRNEVRKVNKIVFALHRAPSGSLTITTRTNRLILESSQVEALKAFLSVSEPELVEEKPC